MSSFRLSKRNVLVVWHGGNRIVPKGWNVSFSFPLYSYYRCVVIFVVFVPASTSVCPDRDFNVVRVFNVIRRVHADLFPPIFKILRVRVVEFFCCVGDIVSSMSSAEVFRMFLVIFFPSSISARVLCQFMKIITISSNVLLEKF